MFEGKKFEEINADDINQLISSSTAEGKQIDFKAKPYNSSIEDSKKEFLADVASFANASGGYLIIGVCEKKGVAESLCPVQITESKEQFSSKWDSIIKGGITPRVHVHYQFIDVDEGVIIVLKIDKGLFRPHCVVYGGKNLYYVRTNAQKQEMDRADLKHAFLEDDTLYERANSFYQNRIVAISNNETPVPFNKEAKCILHVIPLSAQSASEVKIDVVEEYKQRQSGGGLMGLKPMATVGWTPRLNLEGLILAHSNKFDSTYIQVYRNGIVEAVASGMLGDSDSKAIPSVYYEKEIRTTYELVIKYLKSHDIEPPFLVRLTLIGVNGFTFALDYSSTREQNVFDRDVVSPDGILVEDIDQDVDDVLKPIFDLIWNCAGFSGSMNYDKEGQWLIH